MAWVSVHQEVDGAKLRRLYKTIGCSKFEALGILNFLWFWGMKNADENGLVVDADLDVLSRYLYGCGEGSNLDMGRVVQALVDVGWIDMAAGGFYIHDWDQWQEQWYKLQKTRKNDAERKRRAYQVWDGGYNCISPISKSAAKKFWTRYSASHDVEMK